MTEMRAAPKRLVFAVAGFFALLPGVAIGGAIALPALVGVSALLALDPKIIRQAIANKALMLVLAAGLLAFLAASSLWSPYAGATYLKVPLTVGMGLLLAAAIASPGLARLSLAGALAALVVLLIMLIIEAAWGAPLNRAAAPDASAFQINQSPARGGVVMLALIWPALTWLIATGVAWRWVGAAIISAAALYASLQFGQSSNALGLAVGAVFFLLAMIAPRLAIMLPSFGLTIWALIAPFVTPLLFAGPTLPDWLPHSWAVRIGIWRYTSARILEQPWFGHGLDAGRASTVMTTYDGEVSRVIPVHAHSATLQIWYDAGAVGALLMAAILALTGLGLWRAHATRPITAAPAAALLAMFGVMANIGWSPYQEWWLSTIILAGALVAAIAVNEQNARSPDSSAPRA